MTRFVGYWLTLLIFLSGPVVEGKVRFGPRFLAAETTAARVVTQRHHGLPKFLGGDAQQILSKLDQKIHSELHSILRQNLREAGIPLNAGGRGGSAADWARYMNANPGPQRTAFDAVLDASSAIDVKHGTNVTQDVWRNVMNGSFTPFP